MKTLEKVKKMVALGIGLSMVGATVFGASAMKLSDYPAPYVVDGVPASNLAIIVGDEAEASDTIALGEIMQGLQTAAVIKTPIAGGGGARVQLLGDSVEVGTPTNLLELKETIGYVRETLTEFDLNILKGGSITTKRGVTKYNQYLNYNNTKEFESNKVIFTEDEFDNVGHFFYVKDGSVLFEWELEFEEGLTSDISGTSLVDLDDRDVNVLGTEYAIVSTYFNNDSNKARIEMLGGPVFDALGEGDKKTYTVNGKEYEVEVIIISETANSGAGEVLIKVNGQTLPKMKAAETEPLANGVLVGIRDIIPTGKDTQSSVVRFYLDATKIEMEDSNYTDSSFTVAGTTINNERIEDSMVQIKMNYNSGLQQATIQDIRYDLKSDALFGDLYVPPSHGTREYLDEPEGMLAPVWDMKYEGLIDTGSTTIKLNPIGRDEYKLEFTNQEGLTYVVPTLSARQDGNLRWGSYGSSAQRALYFIEANTSYDKPIKLYDYFVLSNINEPVANATCPALFQGSKPADSNTDNTAFTRIVKFDQVDTNNHVLTFTDLATGTKQIPYDTSTQTADLIVGGIRYKVYLNDTNSSIAVDLNGDADVALDVAIMGAEGGALIVLGNNYSQDTGYAGQSSYATINTSSTITTLKKQFDERTTHETTCIVFETRTGSKIGINKNGFTGLLFPFRYLTSNPEIAQAMSEYGTFWELYDPSTVDTPEELTIEYPLSERGVQVFVTAGQVQATESSQGVTEKVQPLPVGASKLASEVADVTMYNAIVVGGPCANPVAAELMNFPDPCWESVPQNQAIVRLYEHANKNVAMLVAGRTALNTRQAARALLTGQLSKVDSKEATVSGTSLTDVSVKAV